MIPRTLLRSQKGGRLLRAVTVDRGAPSTNTASTANTLRLFHSNTFTLSSQLPCMAGGNHAGSLLRCDSKLEDKSATTSRYSMNFIKLLPDEESNTQQQPTSYHRQLHARMLSTQSTSSSAPSSSNSDNNNKEEETKPAEKATFRTMVRQYGPIFISTYLTVYVSTVFGFYLGITSGALDPAYLLSFITSSAAENADPDAASNTANSLAIIKEVLNTYSWTQPAVPFVEKYPWAANLGVAWVVTKPTEPIRFGLTVGLTPIVARMLGYNNQKIAEKAVEEGQTAKEEAS